MILPPFTPPKFDEMSKWWNSCTYADVHRLILEVLHLRLTMSEMSGLTGDATRMIAYLDRADELKYAAPLRRLSIKIDREISRAGRMGNPRAPVAPFSDEWRAREAMKCRLHDTPEEPDPGSDKATKLPEFRRLTWEELRDAAGLALFGAKPGMVVPPRCRSTHLRQMMSVMINNPRYLGGAMDKAAGEKTARLVQLCDTFHLPIVYLCDEPGFMTGLEEEKKGISDDVRDVYAEAKANGYDPKIMRMIVRLRKMETHTRQEQDAVLETYRQALGLA